MWVAVPPMPSRRTLLAGSASLAAGAALPFAVRAVANPAEELELTAALGHVAMAGGSYSATEVWCYGDRVPGPEIRVRQGERVRIVVHNQLPEETTVHWHSIRRPNAMNGVPGLTQPPLNP